MYLNEKLVIQLWSIAENTYNVANNRKKNVLVWVTKGVFSRQ